MTYTRAVICIVGSKAGPHHLLNHVNVLIRGTGTRKTCQGFRTVLFLDLHEFGGHQIQCLIPACTLEFSGLFVLDERIFHSVR